MKLGSALLALCAGGLFSGVLWAAQYAVPGLGTLELEVPRGWRVQERAGPVTLHLQLRPESGDRFLFLVSANWIHRDGRAEFAARPVKERVEGMAKSILPRAVEKEAPLVELRGKHLSGYHFSVTDSRSSEAGDYRYMTQGMIAGEAGFVLFTLLQRDADVAERQEALKMLAGSSYAGDSRAPVELADDALRIAQGDRHFELWVPASRIYMTVPRAKLAPTRNPFGGAAGNPRYFYFTDRAFNLSGWFEPAEKFAGARKHWERDTAAWKERGVPQPNDVVFAKVGGWKAVYYDHAMPGGATNSHIRAHWVQAETWIDVHLSITSNAPSAQLREALTTFLQAMSVRER
jgi:hypothetical protein